MIALYLKSINRNFQRNLQTAILNLFGLTMGIATTILIALFLIDESIKDDLVPNRDQIFRMEAIVNQNGETGVQSATIHSGIAPVIQEELPEIEAAVRMYKTKVHVKKNSGPETALVKESFLHVDANFFKVFDFDMVYGDLDKALNDPNSVIITEQMAEKYFEEENPIGEILTTSGSRGRESQYVVRGIIETIPRSTSLQFDFIRPIKFDEQYPSLESRSWSAYPTYIKLTSNTTVNELPQRVHDLLKRYTEVSSLLESKFLFIPFEEVKYTTASSDAIIVSKDKRVLFLFGAVALLIIVLATINYINLTTARALRKGQEIGIRKIIGATRRSIISQSLIESFIYALFSLIIAILLLEISLPYFEQILGQSLIYSRWEDPTFAGLLFVFIVIISSISGIYPALLVSNFRFNDFLKGKLENSMKGVFLRKCLVVFQFVISIVLILGAVLVQTQLNYINQKNLSYEPEQLLVLNNTYPPNFELLEERIASIPGVLNTSATSMVPGPSDYRGGTTITRDFDFALKFYYVDSDFLKILNLEMVQGNNFSSTPSKSDKQGIIVNETLAKAIIDTNPHNLDDPLTGKYQILFGSKPFFIQGVVKDFHIESLHHGIKPVFLINTASGGNSKRSVNKVLVKFDVNAISNILPQISSVWDEIYPDIPLSYEFLDDRFDRLYTSELRIAKVFNIFTGIAILISFLGLFGLITFLSEVKLKEISIRKVLGAQISGIILLLTRQVYILILVSSIIAIPVSSYLINQWLLGFTYKVNISPWVIILTSISAFIIAGLTMAIRTYKAATTNPINVLRNK